MYLFPVYLTFWFLEADLHEFDVRMRQIVLVILAPVVVPPVFVVEVEGLAGELSYHLSALVL